jgi:hypothetical protein
LDDDLDYPVNYVSYMLSKLAQYGDKAVVGVHGSYIRSEFSDYYDRESRQVFVYDKELVDDQQVNILGTGTVAYARSLLSPGLQDFHSTGMADLWFALIAKSAEVPMMAVARAAGYLQAISGLPESCLYEDSRESSNPQTRFIHEYGPWSLPRL